MVRGFRFTDNGRSLLATATVLAPLVLFARPGLAEAQLHTADARRPTLTLGLPRPEDASRAASAELTEHRPVSPGNWPRLHIFDPVGRYAAQGALNLAWDRLAQSDCAAILAGFGDQSGRPLAERLAALPVDVQTYLTGLVFIDGSRDAPCVAGVFAFTTPGTRVIRLCVGAVKRTWQEKAEHAVVSLIHEMLHTLGLGEDPPSSAEITRRVSAACRRQR